MCFSEHKKATVGMGVSAITQTAQLRSCYSESSLLGDSARHKNVESINERSRELSQEQKNQSRNKRREPCTTASGKQSRAQPRPTISIANASSHIDSRTPARVKPRSVAAQPPHRGITNTSWRGLFPKHFHHLRHLDESSSPARPADACLASSRAQPVKNAGLPLFDFAKQARLLDAKQPFRTLPICSGQLNSVLRACSTISGDEPWSMCPAAPSTN